MAEITREDIPYVFDAPPPAEMIGGMTQPHIHFESLAKIYTPESARKDVGVIVLPGFGHRVGALGEAFDDHARTIAQQLGVVGAVAVDNESDDQKLAFWQIPGAGKAWALRNAIEVLIKRLVSKQVIVGFSNSAYDAMEVASQTLSVIGLILVAPTANPEKIVETMKKAGRSVTPDPLDVGSLLIGSRKTLVAHDLSGDIEPSARAAAKHMRMFADNIGRRHIPLSVLWGIGDRVVSRDQAEQVATLLSTKITVVDSEGTMDSFIHDFNSAPMRNALIQELRNKHILSSS